jgi:hypothetical protein
VISWSQDNSWNQANSIGHSFGYFVDKAPNNIEIFSCVSIGEIACPNEMDVRVLEHRRERRAYNQLRAIKKGAGLPIQMHVTQVQQ